MSDYIRAPWGLPFCRRAYNTGFVTGVALTLGLVSLVWLVLR